jgi:hypothetical protein
VIAWLMVLLLGVVAGWYVLRPTPPLAQVVSKPQSLSVSPQAQTEPQTPFSPDAGVSPGSKPSALGATAVDYPIDIEALRAKLPDNLYFRQDAPTTDETELERRHQEQVQWNERFGRVQSGEATAEEIATYFEHQERVSRDYVQFCEAALEMGKTTLPDRDRGLFEYGVVLHTQKLKDLPGHRQAALQRRQEQEARQRAWRDPKE